MSHKITYRYYCITENNWIDEEKTHMDTHPSVCKNNNEHAIKLDSVHVPNRVMGNYCNMKELIGSEPDTTTQYNTSNITLEELAKIVRTIQLCGAKLGFIKLI